MKCVQLLSITPFEDGTGTEKSLGNTCPLPQFLGPLRGPVAQLPPSKGEVDPQKRKLGATVLPPFPVPARF